jgi:tetratricopeptide (TPR) repeat protein
VQYGVIALAIFVFAYCGLAMIVPHHLNLRYVAPAEGPFYLLAGVGVKQLLIWTGKLIPMAGERPLQVAAAVVICVVAAHDYSTFLNSFAKPDLQDLSIRMVLAAGGIEPPQITQPVASLLPLETYAQRQLTATQWVELSNLYAKNGRNDESIAAARQALALEPGNAVAWNNIAAANENMQHWDEAIAAAQLAIKLQPDFQLAKNNLAWSIAQKNKQAGK